MFPAQKTRDHANPKPRSFSSEATDLAWVLTFARRHPEVPRFLQRGKGSRAYNLNLIHSARKQATTIAQHLSGLRSTEAAALIEFAVALPLLVVLVVGIFDFGGAFNLKQELSNAVREGARFGASQPTNDLNLAKPPSVDAVRFLVDSYLQTAKINDCGLSTAPMPFSGGSLTWSYNVSGGGCSLTLIISRGITVPETVGGSTIKLICTTVHISYPYQWHFNNVIKLLVPGANYTLGNIQGDATAVNMN